MRLELGTFPVKDIVFGGATRYDAGQLTVDRDAVLAAVRQDPRIATAEIEIARPGESVRIWPVRDVIEPRIKVAGPGVCYPGICGRDIATVGEGRTHRLAGMGEVEIADGVLHEDVRTDIAHAALVSASERDPGRCADGPVSHGVRDVVDGGEQPAVPRPLSAPRQGLELPRRDLTPHGVDDKDREAAHGQPDGQAREA